jgi:hypothetical protein
MIKDHVTRVCRSHFFDADTMRFFKSRIGSQVFPSARQGVTYFTTSEKGPDEVRRYSVKRLKGCELDTVGEFQEHRTQAAAQAVAKRMANNPLLTGALGRSRGRRKRR